MNEPKPSTPRGPVTEHDDRVDQPSEHGAKTGQSGAQAGNDDMKQKPGAVPKKID